MYRDGIVGAAVVRSRDAAGSRAVLPPLLDGVSETDRLLRWRIVPAVDVRRGGRGQLNLPDADDEVGGSAAV